MIPLPPRFEAVARVPQALLIGLVQGYRYLLKPWVGNACRFEPTCSAYALQALEQHGALGGTLLSGWRLLRCHPWCDGGCDPVPMVSPATGLFTRFTHAVADAAGGRSPDGPRTTPLDPAPGILPGTSPDARP